jgi:hypothetical protein
MAISPPSGKGNSKSFGARPRVRAVAHDHPAGMTKTISSTALASSPGDFERPLTSHCLDAMAE